MPASIRASAPSTSRRFGRRSRSTRTATSISEREMRTETEMGAPPEGERRWAAAHVEAVGILVGLRIPVPGQRGEDQVRARRDRDVAPDDVLRVLPRQHRDGRDPANRFLGRPAALASRLPRTYSSWWDG